MGGVAGEREVLGANVDLHILFYSLHIKTKQNEVETELKGSKKKESEN